MVVLLLLRRRRRSQWLSEGSAISCAMNESSFRLGCNPKALSNIASHVVVEGA